MKTYIIQYFKNGSWRNYTDHHGDSVEFLTLHAANQVAVDLAAFYGLVEERGWQIKSSEGKVFHREGSCHVSQNASGSGT